MTWMQKIRTILVGAVMILFALLLLAVPQYSVQLVIIVLGFTFFVSGLRNLVYYITMARHMIGGKSILYRGIIVLDLGVLALSLLAEAPVVALMYLLFCRGLSGVIGLLRSLEAKKMDSPEWKAGIVHAAVDLAIVVLGTIFLRSPMTVIYVYAAGLVYSGAARIISAFRRTAIIYVQ